MYILPCFGEEFLEAGLALFDEVRVCCPGFVGDRFGVFGGDVLVVELEAWEEEVFVESPAGLGA